MFVLGGREMAGALDEVREVVRATGIEGLAGTRAPVTGLVDLRSDADPGQSGDVLVLSPTVGVLGLAVDRVVSVLGPDELQPPSAAEPRPHGLPSYVVEVRRDATARAVLVVSLPALAGLVSA